MTDMCRGQIALVTGASRGIGQALSIRLAAEGAAVVAVGRTAHAGEGDYAGSLDETMAGIADVGGRGVAVVADLSDGDSRRRAADAAQAELGGPVTILVNNAAGPRAFDLKFGEMTADAFRLALEVNIWAAWELSTLVIPGMREAGAGWILNISSRQAAPRWGPPFPAHAHGGACLYGGTKAMLDRLTTGAAMDLYDENIAVNALAPESAVATPHASAVANLPADRTEPMESFVSAAVALVSAEPRTLTGRVAYSLSLIKELGTEVRSLDGRELIPGWQPDEIDPARLYPPYLREPAR